MRVFVYYNLNKHCLSLRAMDGPSKGRVVLHAEAAWLRNVSFRVSEAGRQRVLRERCKNVHAGLVGELVAALPAGLAWVGAMPGIPVTYDPYKGPSFIERHSGRPVVEAVSASIVRRDVRVVN